MKTKFIRDLAIGDLIRFNGGRTMQLTEKTDKDKHSVNLTLLNTQTGSSAQACFGRMDVVELDE